MNALYNEIEPFAAQWLGNLIAAGHIAKGDVDDRSISELRSTDLVGRAQCHFFAGIGVWSYALRRAGWPDNVPVWTGSCPCQPFSSAGRGGGFDDERHLWPTWFALIRECRPPVVFGEQVASPDGLAWLDLVHADLEGAGYAVGATDLCAAGVGAPHLRQRLYFVAHADSSDVGQRLHVPQRQSRREVSDADRCGEAGGNREDMQGVRSGHAVHGLGLLRDTQLVEGIDDGPDCTLANASSNERRSGRRHPALEGRAEQRRATQQSTGRGDVVVADAVLAGRTERRAESGERPFTRSGGDCPWSDCDWIACSDGVSRPVEPGAFPLAHGATARVGRLRAYGNAIVSEAAVTFIRAAMEAMP